MGDRMMRRLSSSVSVVMLGGGLLLALAACNQVTGAGNLEVAGDKAGSGGDGGGGPSGVGGAGSGVTTGGATQCTYPTTGFSKKVGGVIPAGFTWKGFADGSDVEGEVLFDDYFDCDGTKGVNAILLLTSATWCGSCQQEAQELKGTSAKFQDWQAKGIKVITLMIEDINQGQPATVKTAQKWKSQFKLENAVVADPKFTFAPDAGGSIGLPYQVLIDPRTMTVVDIQEGYSGNYAKVTALATKNATAK